MHASTSISVLALTAFLAACSQDAPPTGESIGAQAPATTATRGAAPLPANVDPVESLLALSGEGLALVEQDSGAIRPLAFGLDMARVLDTLARVRGAPQEQFENPECGAGPMQTAHWADGLSVNFQDGRFVGWGLGARDGGDAARQDRLTTPAGIGIGSSRGELEAAYAVQVFESTLGTEFSAGNLAGLLDSPRGDAKVTTLWAGTNCIFR